MPVRYYVLVRQHEFCVFRETMHKGSHTFRSRALDAARAMARLETRFTGEPTELMLEEAEGVLTLAERFEAPRPLDGTQPPRPRDRSTAALG